jgi:acyl-CoA dehydrogenase
MPTFRAETRDWLEENCPPAMRSFMPENEQVAGGKRARYVRPEQKQWLDRMAAKGWTAPTWPKKYGGGGLSNDEALILEEEMQDLGCRLPLRGMGLSMLGPVLLEYGTEEQRQTHIPPIVRGEIRWCQGYSEPEAGSEPSFRASTSWSTATRSGPPTPTIPTGYSASSAPTPRRKSTKASASC